MTYLPVSLSWWVTYQGPDVRTKQKVGLRPRNATSLVRRGLGHLFCFWVFVERGGYWTNFSSGSYSWSQPPTLCWLPHPLPLILAGLLHFSLHDTYSVPSSFPESRLREEEEFRRHIVLTASL